MQPQKRTPKHPIVRQIEQLAPLLAELQSLSPGELEEQMAQLDAHQRADVMRTIEKMTRWAERAEAFLDHMRARAAARAEGPRPNREPW